MFTGRVSANEKSIRGMLRMTSDRTCRVRSFALSPGDRPANPVEPVAPASSFLTFLLRVYRPCSPHASDANTIQRQHGTRSRHADRQETGRPANHRGGAPTQSTPREQASLVDSGHPPGRFSTKRLFCERNPASRNHPLRVHILICRISAPPSPRTRRFPVGSCRSTPNRAIIESG